MFPLQNAQRITLHVWMVAAFPIPCYVMVRCTVLTAAMRSISVVCFHFQSHLCSHFVDHFRLTLHWPFYVDILLAPLW